MMNQVPKFTVTKELGIGYVDDVALNTQSHLDMFDISDNLTESLALEDWVENERNEMSANMDNITITTINSTRVNAL